MNAELAVGFGFVALRVVVVWFSLGLLVIASAGVTVSRVLGFCCKIFIQDGRNKIALLFYALKSPAVAIEVNSRSVLTEFRSSV